MHKSYIRILPDKKPQIIKDIAFCDILEGKFIIEDERYTDLISRLDEEILQSHAVTKGALSNVHGDWYEWLIAMEGWNLCVNNNALNVPLLLPKITSFDVAELYESKLCNLIYDLRAKVETASKVSLISSNPDFVIVSRQIFEESIKEAKSFDEFSLKNLGTLNNAYKRLISKCSFEDIKGYIAVKTSLRPDRRLQIPHEGSLMKAIYTHLQTREWIIDPPGLKFYAFSSKISNADRNVLKTVATHSITTVSSMPQAAVDEVFAVNSPSQAQEAFYQILSN